MKTKVLFRRWSDGDILALFPCDPGTNNPGTCSSYAHLGQHSSADLQLCIAASRPAAPAEYADLAQELTRIGYNLDIRPRTPRNAYKLRCAQL